MSAFRNALGSGIVAALLAACGAPRQAQDDTQPLIGAPGTRPQSRAIAAHAERGGSWMLPEAKSADLLYVSSSDGDVRTYSYPNGKLVGTLSGFTAPVGECVDASGDIFITAFSSPTSTSSSIYEYTHGGSTPIAILSDPGHALGCSIDSTSGDLAVANIYDPSNPYNIGYGSVAIYQAAQGTPKMYYDSQYGVLLCGYDNRGVLYVSVANGSPNEVVFARLSKRRGSFVKLTLDKQIYSSDYFAPVPQWDGSHMTVSFDEHSGVKASAPITVYQLSISGTKATVIGTTTLNSPKNHHEGQIWIQGHTIVGTYYDRGYANVGLWAYPTGGDLEHGIKKIARNTVSLHGAAVSVAPSR